MKRHGGLTQVEVSSQRSRHGRNEIVEVSGHPWVELAAETLKDPMIWFLLGIGTVFLLTGDKSEAVILFVAILPLTFMDAVLHWRTQASTASLKGQLGSRIHVLRDAGKIQVDTRDLVPGDLVVISSGELLPADGMFERAKDMQIDESVLTGEAFPIQKKNSDIDPFALATAGDVAIPAETLGYAGTRVLTGEGLMRVLFTGQRTSYGEIVQSVARMPHERTPLQKSISRLVRILIYVAAVFCLVLAVIRLYQGHGWLDALLSAATLAVAAIPEEFPVVFTFFLGVGVYRLAKKRALVRRAVSVENIGRVTQICTDKTGTITVGQLKLTHIDAYEWLAEHEVLEAALAASRSWETDPIDIAVTEKARALGLRRPHLMRTIPFTEDRKRETGLVRSRDGLVSAFTKGSPETILAMSTLLGDEQERWKEKVRKWAKEGHRVIACARKRVAPEGLDSGVEPEAGFEFCGLLAFEDPPRPEVARAMRYCRENGIRVLMITGDHPDTAAAIAKDAGLAPGSPKVISAEDEPRKFEEKWLERNPDFLRDFDVVARCSPLQKLRIVMALKKSGELVAVTGDGVNDVPALKAADIGIAMGQRGTRSAKEVSSIILADDNFSTIVNAIMEGRQLFMNLQMSFEYLLLFHIPLVLTAALIPLLGYPLLYLPVHIVWMELIIHPTALLAFQAVASPRTGTGTVKKNASFFSRVDGIRVIAIGFGLTLALGISFIAGISEASDVGHGRAKALALLTLWSASLIVYFTRLKAAMAALMAIATMVSALFLIQVPHMSRILHLSPLHFQDWLEVLGITIAFIVMLEIARRPHSFRGRLFLYPRLGRSRMSG